MGAAKDISRYFTRISAPALLWFVVFSSSAGAAEFYVSSSSGLDSNPGTQALPFATIPRAQQAVRSINGQMSEDIVVWLRDGIYRLAQPLTFTPEDSGTNGFYVKYAAYPNEKPILSGGMRITGWQVSDSARKIYVASARGQKFRQLYVGDTHGIRSRHPDLTASPNFLRANSIFQGADGYLRIDVNSTSLGSSLKTALASTTYQKDVEIVMYYNFNMSRLRILGGAEVVGTGVYRLVVMSPDGQLEYTKSQLAKSRYEPQGQSFYLEHYPGFLNQPNEWYLDAANDRVYFRAPDTVTSAADLEALGVVIPTGTATGNNETFVLLQGRTDTGQPVHHLTFERLIFAHSNWLGPSDSGFVGSWTTRRYVSSPSDPSGVRIERAPAAVDLNYTEHIAFTGNVFQDLGGSGIRAAGITKDFHVVGNAFLEINGNGIEFGGPERRDRVLIESNRFKVIGWDYHGMAVQAPGVYDLKIRHNDIDFTTSAAIQTRGGSGPGAGVACYGDNFLSGATGNEVSANKISRPTSRIFDMGAIYNACKQTLAVNYNVIANIVAPAWYAHLPYYSLGGIGVYLDFGSYGVMAKGNTVRNVPHPFYLNCESNNTFANNRTDLAPGTESSATRRGCVVLSPVYGPSTSVVVDSNASTVPAIPSGVVIGMRPKDKAFLDWLTANVNRDFPSTLAP